MTGLLVRGLILVIPFALATVASAAPIVGCVGNMSGGRTCFLLEQNANGGASELSPTFNIGSNVTPGTVYFCEPGIDCANPNNQVLLNIGDVFVFLTSVDTTTIQLRSVGCGIGPGDKSCFPAIHSGAEAFVNELGNGTLFYSAPSGQTATNDYTGQSTPDSLTPEPATVMTSGAGAGLIGMIAAWRRRKTKQQ